MARGSQSARLAAYTHLKHEISQLNLSSLCFLQEMDAQNHTRYLPFLSFRESQEQTIQLELLGYDFCNHLNNVVGYYFAPKDDHLIYAVDFVAYYLRLRSKGCVTSFQRDMLSSSPDLSPLIMRDQIIMAREKPV